MHALNFWKTARQADRAFRYVSVSSEALEFARDIWAGTAPLDETAILLRETGLYGQTSSGNSRASVARSTEVEVKPARGAQFHPTRPRVSGK